MKISFISTFRKEYLLSENVIFIYLNVQYNVVTRNNKKSNLLFCENYLLLLINIIFCGFIPIYLLHNILDNIVIFKLNGSLLKYNNY